MKRILSSNESNFIRDKKRKRTDYYEKMNKIQKLEELSMKLKKITNEYIELSRLDFFKKKTSQPFFEKKKKSKIDVQSDNSSDSSEEDIYEKKHTSEYKKLIKNKYKKQNYSSSSSDESLIEYSSSESSSSDLKSDCSFEGAFTDNEMTIHDSNQKKSKNEESESEESKNEESEIELIDNVESNSDTVSEDESDIEFKENLKKASKNKITLHTKEVDLKKNKTLEKNEEKTTTTLIDSDLSTEVEEIPMTRLEKKAEKLTEKAEKNLSKVTTKNRKDQEKELNKLEKRTNENEISSDIINIYRGKDVNPVYFTKKMIEKLKPHQIDGIRFMWKRIHEMEDKNKGCIFSHSMGLGKTLSSIVFICASFGNKLINNVVIICPKTTMKSTWSNEFEKWCADIGMQTPTIFAMGDTCTTQTDRQHLIRNWHEKEKSVLLISYNMFSKIVNGKSGIGGDFIKTLLGMDLVVMDEGHLVKNSDSKIHDAITQINTRRRIILTGTPLQNNLSEYYTMASIVQANFWEKADFKNFFLKPIKEGSANIATAIQVATMRRRMYYFVDETKKFTQRVNQSILKQYLPEKNEFIIYIKLTDFQIELYKNFLAYTKKKELNKKEKKNYLYDCCTFQKIIDHPDFIHFFIERTKNNKTKEITEKKKESEEEEEPEEIIEEKDDFSWAASVRSNHNLYNVELSNKMKILMDILNLTSKINEKIIVFSQYTKTLDYIENVLKNTKVGSIFLKKNVHYYKSDGKTSSSDRENYINKFNKSEESKIFLASTKACSLGINLTGASRLVLFDVSWNPTQDQQSIFRLYRFGQEKPVYIYRLVSTDTIEEQIWDRCVNKTWLFTNIIDDKSTKISLKKDDMAIYDSVPKNDYITKIDESIVNKDKLMIDLIAINKNVINSVLSHESLYVDDETILTEEEKKKVIDEYTNRNKQIEKPKLSSQPIPHLGKFKILDKRTIEQPEPIHIDEIEFISNLQNINYKKQPVVDNPNNINKVKYVIN